MTLGRLNASKREKKNIDYSFIKIDFAVTVRLLSPQA